MREPTSYKDLKSIHSSAQPSESLDVSPQQADGGAGNPEPPNPPSSYPEEPNRPDKMPGPSPWAPYLNANPDYVSFTKAGGEAAKNLNEALAERREDEIKTAGDIDSLNRFDPQTEVSQTDLTDLEPAGKDSPPIDDPGTPEPLSGQGISEEDFEKIVGGQDRGAEQLPREPNRPDYGDLKREQSQADGPKSFAERHPPQGPEIER